MDTAVAAPLIVQGMHGMGDNLHQRALIRQWMQARTVYLETPWPCIYHDLVGPRLHLIKKSSSLRTQAKNLRREDAQYSKLPPPSGAKVAKIWYTPDMVRRNGSMLAAMIAGAGLDYPTADFRLPIPDEWSARLRLPATDKPVMLYRPLVERPEWGGCASRNADYVAYRALFDTIRDRFHVVSVADLVPNVEWIVGQRIKADTEYHEGQLAFEELAALAKRAVLVYCSPGFAMLLGQAVGTPTICVFGGHENSKTISAGARYTPTLGIDPIVPCDCFDHRHKHQKAINIPIAAERVRQFVDDECVPLEHERQHRVPDAAVDTLRTQAC